MKWMEEKKFRVSMEMLYEIGKISKNNIIVKEIY